MPFRPALRQSKCGDAMFRNGVVLTHNIDSFPNTAFTHNINIDIFANDVFYCPLMSNSFSSHLFSFAFFLHSLFCLFCSLSLSLPQSPLPPPRCLCTPPPRSSSGSHIFFRRHSRYLPHFLNSECVMLVIVIVECSSVSAHRPCGSPLCLPGTHTHTQTYDAKTDSAGVISTPQHYSSPEGGVRQPGVLLVGSGSLSQSEHSLLTRPYGNAKVLIQGRPS